MIRRSMVGTLALLMISLLVSAEEKRVIILGFDGVDPGIVDTMLQAGELPNLQKLSETGGFQRLQSSNPPQSPTAWSNFSTCKTAMNHGIFDFLRRNPKNYVPSPGFGAMKHPELQPDGALKTAASYSNFRDGETFWKVASDQGKRIKALVVPFAYPADDLSEGCHQLCGLDIPDIRGTQSTYFALAEDIQKQEPVPGGMRLPLAFTGDTATVKVPGIRYPGKRSFVEVPVTISVDRAAKAVTLSIQGQECTLKEGAWSDWLEWTFDLSAKYQVHAVSRFHCMASGDSVRLYMTCLQHHPEHPMMPISVPEAYSGELADRYGLYKTVGWAFDTKALEKDDMDEAMFLQDIHTTMSWREQLCLDEIDRGDFELLVAAWTGTDRVAHMFWRARDPKHPAYTEALNEQYGRAVEDTYTKMDQIVGNVMQRLQPGDLFMVMSDHGFHSFRYGFNLNTWFVRNGYLTLTGQTDAATAHTDKKYLIDFKTGKYHYDWSKTKAYGLGLSMAFLNRQGREKQGIVSQAEAPALLEEIREKLLAVTYPETGEKVFTSVTVHPDASGPETPDIQLGYNEGFQMGKASAAGAAPKELFTPNTNKWSGEHASSDTASTPGIFFTNQAMTQSPALPDLGVTALDYLDVSIPDDFEGKSLF